MSDIKEDVEEETGPIVIDHGSGMIKYGYGGEDTPLGMMPSVIGRPRHIGVMVGMGQKDCYVGDEAIAKRGILTLKYPLQHGMINNWDDMEQIWHHLFYNELRVNPDEQNVFLTEPPNNPSPQRQKMTQIMFETFEVLSTHLANRGVLSLYATGKQTGLLFHCGATVTYLAAIYEGYIMNNAQFTVDAGGTTITRYLQELLNKKTGYSFVSTAEMEIVREIKEKMCYVTMGFDSAMQKCGWTREYQGTNWNGLTDINSIVSYNSYKTDNIDAVLGNEMEANYELPDGQILCLNYERFSCVEKFFYDRRTCLNYDQMYGIVGLISGCINKCDIHLRKELRSNVVLSGGSTMFDGFDQRLQMELGNDSKIVETKDLNRRYASWIGASVLTTILKKYELWINKEEYDEAGPSIVHRKCGYHNAKCF